MPILINKGSVDDIRCHLKLYQKTLTTEQLLSEIEAEKKKHNRKSVIDMLTAAIERKKGGQQQ